MPNIDTKAITKRLDIMRGQLRKVFTATGTDTIQQLKEFIVLGKPRRGIKFYPQSVHNYVSSRTMVLMASNMHEIEQKFRLQHVNGKDHLFVTENFVSKHEIINQILLKLKYPIKYIPENVRNDLKAQHTPYDSIHPEIYIPYSDYLFSWMFHGLPGAITDIIRNELRRIFSQKWTDVEELFENANRLSQLLQWKRGLQQGHAGRSLLLNLPDGGPANLVGTFVTGVRRNGGLRPGKHNLRIDDQVQALIDSLMPEIPHVGELIIPYRTQEEYERDVLINNNRYKDFTYNPYAARAARAAVAPAAPAVAPAAAPAAPTAAPTAVPAAPVAVPVLEEQEALIPRPPRGLCQRMTNGIMQCFGRKTRNNIHNDRSRTRKRKTNRKKTRRIR